MIIEILIGLIAILLGCYLIYLLGELGKIIFNSKEWIEGFALLVIFSLLISALVGLSYFIGKFIMGLI